MFSVTDIAKKEKVTLTIASHNAQIFFEDNVEDNIVTEDDMEMQESLKLLIESRQKSTRALNITDRFEALNDHGIRDKAVTGEWVHCCHEICGCY